MPPTRSVSPLSDDERFSIPLIVERDRFNRIASFRESDQFHHRQSVDVGTPMRTLNPNEGNNGSRSHLVSTEKQQQQQTHKKVKAGLETYVADFLALVIAIGILILIIVIVCKNGKELTAYQIKVWKNCAYFVSERGQLGQQTKKNLGELLIRKNRRHLRRFLLSSQLYLVVS